MGVPDSSLCYLCYIGSGAIRSGAWWCLREEVAEGDWIRNHCLCLGLAGLPVSICWTLETFWPSSLVTFLFALQVTRPEPFTGHFGLL